MVWKDTIDDFKQWKETYPSTYEILFSLLLRWGDICKDLHGYNKIAHMWEHHTNSTRRWSQASLHVAKHVMRYRILNIYLNSTAQTFAIEVELEFINGLGEVKSSHYISEIIKEDIVCDIEDEVMKYLTGKSNDCEDKPGVTYQHISTAKPGSTETQNAIERLLKNSFYGAQAIGYNGKPYIDNEKYLDSIVEAAIRKKLIDENDISVGDFEGAKDAFSFEYHGITFKAYVKSIAYVTAEYYHPGAPWKRIALHDLIVSTDDNQGTELDIRVDSVVCYGIHFDLRRGGLTDAITGVHVSRIKREWADYIQRKHIRLGKIAVHHLEPITPVTYNLADVEFCTDLYNHLNEKENKEMKENENKIIINHNAVIVYIGKQKAVVSVIDKKTKEETGSWNTKAGVIMAIAKVFGIGTHMYKMYEVLNTINKPTNKTLDFVADEIRLNGKRIKNYEWYHKAINTKRPEPGKQIEIIMGTK